MRAANAWLEGADALKMRLHFLGRELEGKALLEAADAAGALVEERARELAPEDEGDLKRAIGRKVSQVGPGVASVAIGYDKKVALHGGWQELGTAHHAAQPFLRPAVRRRKQSLVNAVAARLRKAIGL